MPDAPRYSECRAEISREDHHGQDIPFPKVNLPSLPDGYIDDIGRVRAPVSRPTDQGKESPI